MIVFHNADRVHYLLLGLDLLQHLSSQTATLTANTIIATKTVVELRILKPS
jgi:hypothetical protein